MLTLRLGMIGFCMAFLASGLAAEPVKRWELTGFETPESALPDSVSGVIYVSNIAGAPDQKDGQGFISKVSLDGKMVAAKWVEGLDAPKGMAIAGAQLYVADIDQLIEIDITTGEIKTRFPAEGAKFLNDVAADAQGRIYVSDMPANIIWRLENGRFEKWLESAALKSPNGLVVRGDSLIVAAWGKMTNGFETEVPGHLIEVSLSDKSVKDLGDGSPVGNLDGLEPFSALTYLATDWVAGKLLRIDRDGKAEELLNLNQGSADIGFMPAERVVLVPMMNDNKLVAYEIE